MLLHLQVKKKGNVKIRIKISLTLEWLRYPIKLLSSYMLSENIPSSPLLIDKENWKRERKNILVLVSFYKNRKVTVAVTPDLLYSLLWNRNDTSWSPCNSKMGALSNQNYYWSEQGLWVDDQLIAPAKWTRLIQIPHHLLTKCYYQKIPSLNTNQSERTNLNKSLASKSLFAK